jgi:beta-lactamase superfamily II metal-dependent hydrolase
MNNLYGFFRKNAIKLRLTSLAILFLAAGFLWTELSWLSSRDLAVYFLDVGQGDAILIRAPGGHTVLIDGGPGRGVLADLAAELPFFVRSLDLVIETHPDSDHAGGLPDVLEHFIVRGVLKPCLGTSTNPYEEALDRLAKEGRVPEICAVAGQLVDLGGGASLEILGAGNGARADTNGASVVVRLSFGRTNFLFMGDATVKEEKYLAYYAAEKLSADVYKVSHHGSRESNDPDFIRAVDPEIAVISVGALNRYGHPHQELLDQLAKNQIEILRTDQFGPVELDSDGEFVKIKKPATR